MKIFNLFQIAVSIVLVALILMQQRGGGLSSAFGGGGEGMYQTKRGAEKWIFYSTIVFSVLFFGFAVANLLI